MPSSVPLTVSDSWVAVTDGTNSGLIHCNQGSVKYTISDTEPVAGAPSYPLSETLTVNAGLKVWVKSANSRYAVLAVTNY